MGAKRVFWHVGFERNFRRRGPRSFEIRSEVPLSEEPLRLDYLFLRRRAAPREVLDDRAETLCALWPRLPRVTVAEYKSPGHPYRSGHLDRLLGYVHGYFANQCALPRRHADGTPRTPDSGGPEVLLREQLCAVLLVPDRTPSLDADVASMGLRWEDLGSGYSKVTGGAFALYVVALDVAGAAEGDDLLCSFGNGELRSPQARWFWLELVGSKDAAMQDMEGYKELMDRLLDTLPPEQVLSHYAPEQRLAGLAPEQRLAGLAPEQRLSGLDRDHQALALPIDVLRSVSEDYLRSLSPEVEAELRRRLRQNGR